MCVCVSFYRQYRSKRWKCRGARSTSKPATVKGIRLSGNISCNKLSCNSDLQLCVCVSSGLKWLEMLKFQTPQKTGQNYASRCKTGFSLMTFGVEPELWPPGARSIVFRGGGAARSSQLQAFPAASDGTVTLHPRNLFDDSLCVSLFPSSFPSLFCHWLCGLKRQEFLS